MRLKVSKSDGIFQRRIGSARRWEDAPKMFYALWLFLDRALIVPLIYLYTWENLHGPRAMTLGHCVLDSRRVPDRTCAGSDHRRTAVGSGEASSRRESGGRFEIPENHPVAFSFYLARYVINTYFPESYELLCSWLLQKASLLDGRIMAFMIGHSNMAVERVWDAN